MDAEERFGGTEEIDVSFRAYHVNLKPEKISEVLNCRPTSASERGDVDELGGLRLPPTQVGSWILSSFESGERGLDINDHVCWLLKRLSPKKLAIQKLLIESYQVGIDCRAKVRREHPTDSLDMTFDLNSNSIKGLAELGVPFRIRVSLFDPAIEALFEE